MNIFGRSRTRNGYDEFRAVLGSKRTRSELVILRDSLRNANANANKILAVEKRIAVMDGFRGA